MNKVKNSGRDNLKELEAKFSSVQPNVFLVSTFLKSLLKSLKTKKSNEVLLHYVDFKY